MSRRRNVAASTTTTLQATPLTTAPERPRLETFVRSAMRQYGLTEQEVRKRAAEMYGSLEYAMQAMETAEIENKAAIERAFPNGYAEIQVGRKPKPGEEVTFSQLRDDLMVRVWGGDLDDCYCFDFVNRERQYILTPDDVKIYSVATAFTPSIQVLSIEQSLEEAKATTLYSHATRRDPNWETYIVHEGTILRITQKNRPDRFLNIPMRIPNDATLVLQPW